MSASVKVESDKCTGCKLCIYSCPEPNVIKLNADKKVEINDTRCKACLLCVSVCPKDALVKGE